jgi:hypothetical protein
MISERICIRLATMSGRWSGVLRVGFSAHDPSTLSQLPKYACPDLTSKPGYWAKALGERYATEGNVIHYYVSGNGDVHFGLAGKDLGVFFSGIDTRQPLWAMIDLYGNCTTLEMIDVRSSLNNFSNHSSGGSTRPASRNGAVRAAASHPPVLPPSASPVLPAQLQVGRIPSPVSAPLPTSQSAMFAAVAPPTLISHPPPRSVSLENHFSQVSILRNSISAEKFSDKISI